MLKEASKILEIIMEFCRENLNMVIIAGAALILVILLICIAKVFKEDEDMACEVPKFEESKIDEPKLGEPILEKPKTEEANNEALKAEEPKVQDSKEESKTAELKIESTKATSLGAIAKELAELSGEGVKNVEIKIPGAEVKITYLDDTKESEEIEECGSDETVTKETEEVQKLDDSDSETVSKEEEQGETVYVPKKFGPNNMNVARSGKVYSEAELEEQIKD